MKNRREWKRRMGQGFSMFLVICMLLTTQSFGVLAETVSENTAKETAKKEWAEEDTAEKQVQENLPDENAVQEEQPQTADESKTAKTQEAEETAEGASASPANPVHHCTKKDDGSDTTDWSYIYFGSYPQSEVTDAATIAAIDRAIAAGNSTGDTGDDVWVNGIKYRRIAKTDTNYSGYFGDSTYRYFKWERIKWRVLQNNGTDLFVMADMALDCKCYNDEYVDVTWETSTLRKWLNDSFLKTAFSNAEQGAILNTTVVNDDNAEYGTEGGNNTTDKVYLLSIAEATSESYGFCNDYSTYSVSRRLTTSDYANARGAWQDYAGNTWWWLRSPGYDSDNAAEVYSHGYVDRFGINVNNNLDGVATALHLNLSSDLWYVADDGTSGAGGSAGGGSGVISSIQSPTANIPGGSYSTLQKVSLYTPTAGAQIYYTIDGTTPSKSNGTKFTGPIAIGDTLTLKAVAVKDGMPDSDVMVETYDFSGSTAKEVNICPITLGEDQNADVDNDSVTRFFPGNFSCSVANLPITASQTVNPDGSYKLKIAIGVGKADWLDKESRWSKYKKNIDNLEKASDKTKRMTGLLEAFGGETISCVKINKFKKLPELSALGYYELEVDKNGNVVRNTGMLQADAKWKASMDWQFITPIGPLYLTLEGSGKVTGKIGASYEIKNNNIADGEWKKNGSLTLTPGISLEGGYGVAKVATVGAKGSASVPIQIIPASKADFEAKASVHVYVIFVFDYTYDLATYKTNLWDTTDKNKSADSVSQETSADYMQINTDNLKPIDRSYTQYTSQWNGSGKSQNASSGDVVAENVSAETQTQPSDWSELVLQTGVMPNTLPIIRQCGEDMVMVFQATDMNRNTLDSSVLMYSVYHDNTWSQPVAVWDNGTCDMYADLQTVGEDLYLVWQKENATITSSGEDGTDALSEMAEKSEIAIAKYNQTTMQFEDTKFITSDNNTDMMPKLAAAGDKVTAVWVRNTDQNFMQDSGSNQIVYSVLEDGTWSSETVLCETTSGIDEILPYYTDGALYTAYITDLSQENNTNKVYVVTGGAKSTAVSEGTTLASKLQYMDGSLYYYEENALKEYSMQTAALAAATPEDVVIGSNAVIHKNGEKTAILWSNPDQTTCTSVVYSSVKTEDGFSQPVALYETTSSIKYLDGVLEEDGSWELLMNTLSSTDDLHSLVYASMEETPEVEVETITVDDAAKEGEATPISYMVTNTSEETITTLVMSIKDESGIDKQITIPVSIAPGETVYDTENVDLSDVADTTLAEITILADGQIDTGNNTVQTSIAQTDLVLDTIMTESDEDVCIVATVSNKSCIPADATLNLYGNVEQTEVLETVPLGEITSTTSASHTFYVKKSEIAMNENEAAYLPVVVTSDKEDVNMDNNMHIEVTYASLENTDDPGNTDAPGNTDDSGSTDDSGNAGGTTPMPPSSGITSGTGTGSDAGTKTDTPSQSIKVKKLTITAPSAKLAAGKKVKLGLKVSPSNAANKTVKWKVSNKKYASIDKNGKLTLKKAGIGKTITVTATAKDGSKKKATYKIKIMKHAVKSIKLKASSKTVKAGKSVKVKATVKTTGKSANKKLKWTTSNKKYATVTSSGKVKTKKAGKGKTVTITATAMDGSNKKAKIKIKIK